VSEALSPPAAPRFTDCTRAFEVEFDYLHRRVQRLGVWASDAEDLVQDVFVVMWRRWGDYQQERPLRPWMLGIANHLAGRHKQRRLREVFATPPETVDEGPLAEERLASAATRTLVLQALAGLPAKHRGVLVMHELEGVTVAELSKRLRLPLPTAYTRVRRARLALAAQISRLRRS
jgi:RNA polymerase sigma factor (sigma-70 family)